MASGGFQKLGEKEGCLKLQDVKCSICLSLLVRPVNLPCHHTFCLVCIKAHLDMVKLECPLCRVRLSRWIRHAVRTNTLVDEELWDRIQLEFPKLANARVMGEETCLLNDTALVSTLEEQENVAPIEVIDLEEEDLVTKCTVDMTNLSLADLAKSEEKLYEDPNLENSSQTVEDIEQDLKFALQLQKEINKPEAIAKKYELRSRK